MKNLLFFITIVSVIAISIAITINYSHPQSSLVLDNIEALANDEEGNYTDYEKQEESFPEESYSEFRPCTNNPNRSVACGGVKYYDQISCLGTGKVKCTPSKTLTAKIELWEMESVTINIFI